MKGQHLYPAVMATGMVLLAFTLLCRVSVAVADFYALTIYPRLSAVLSWLASWVSFSLQDAALVIIIVAATGIIYTGVTRKWGFRRCIKWEALILLWTFVWFYTAWCNNYYRSSIYLRTRTQPEAYDEQVFRQFIHDFITRTNAEWTSQEAETGEPLEEEIKAFYNSASARYGLAQAKSWQHPKPSIFNSLYSAVGVLGTMEPLFAESCINRDMLTVDYPFVYAHEYAHLLGISSEAECNWWAYHACMTSTHKAMRYSALKNILPHVMRNAQQFLPEDEYQACMAGIRPEVMADLQRTADHWDALRSPALRKIHEVTYDLFLKGNNIPSGRQNYSEVIGMLLSIRPVH